MKKRLDTIGLFSVLLLVAVLVGSLVAGLGRGADDGELATAADAAREGERVRVEVLNAAGTPGLAREATRRLRDAGFDVVFFGNAPGGRRDSTEVLDRSGRPEDAQRVAEALGVLRVTAAPDADLYLDVSVVLGADWAAPSAAAADR
ncbi:MAG: LytR C-terminal domain-containing protein [Gemmatimonadota bacterium]|jgi:calcineurin-like phosphoesterase|nr:LytR C-terminal domain-containing protein [Gemmatimonadota bacterium]